MNAKIRRYIKIAYPKGCCQCCVPTTHVLEKITSYPKCWNLTEISLTLMITHCPCRHCLQDIYDRLILMAPPDQVITRHLTLCICESYATTVTVTEMAEWKVELEKINFSIHLEAIPVLEELPSWIVHRHSDIRRQDWEQVKGVRRFNNVIIQQTVRQIYSEKHRIPTVFDSTTAMGTLTLHN